MLFSCNPEIAPNAIKLFLLLSLMSWAQVQWRVRCAAGSNWYYLLQEYICNYSLACYFIISVDWYGFLNQAVE